MYPVSWLRNELHNWQMDHEFLQFKQHKSFAQWKRLFLDHFMYSLSGPQPEQTMQWNLALPDKFSNEAKSVTILFLKEGDNYPTIIGRHRNQ